MESSGVNDGSRGIADAVAPTKSTACATHAPRTPSPARMFVTYSSGREQLSGETAEITSRHLHAEFFDLLVKPTTLNHTETTRRNASTLTRHAQHIIRNRECDCIAHAPMVLCLDLAPSVDQIDKAALYRGLHLWDLVPAAVRKDIMKDVVQRCINGPTMGFAARLADFSAEMLVIYLLIIYGEAIVIDNLFIPSVTVHSEPSHIINLLAKKLFYDREKYGVDDEDSPYSIARRAANSISTDPMHRYGIMLSFVSAIHLFEHAFTSPGIPMMVDNTKIAPDAVVTLRFPVEAFSDAARERARRVARSHGGDIPIECDYPPLRAIVRKMIGVTGKASPALACNDYTFGFSAWRSDIARSCADMIYVASDAVSRAPRHEPTYAQAIGTLLDIPLCEREALSTHTLTRWAVQHVLYIACLYSTPVHAHGRQYEVCKYHALHFGPDRLREKQMGLIESVHTLLHDIARAAAEDAAQSLIAEFERDKERDRNRRRSHPQSPVKARRTRREPPPSPAAVRRAAAEREAEEAHAALLAAKAARVAAEKVVAAQDAIEAEARETRAETPAPPTATQSPTILFKLDEDASSGRSESVVSAFDADEIFSRGVAPLPTSAGTANQRSSPLFSGFDLCDFMRTTHDPVVEPQRLRQNWRAPGAPMFSTSW